MHRNSAERVGMGFFLLLFAIIVFAVYVNYIAVVSFRDYLRARDFVPAQAQIVELNIKNRTTTKGERYVRIEHVRYRYDYDGSTYESTRYSVFPYLGHGSATRVLADARIRGSPVTAWVNSLNPNDAVLDREMRQGLVGWVISTVLVVMWAAIGFICITVFIDVLFGGRLITFRLIERAKPHAGEL